MRGYLINILNCFIPKHTLESSDLVDNCQIVYYNSKPNPQYYTVDSNREISFFNGISSTEIFATSNLDVCSNTSVISGKIHPAKLFLHWFKDFPFCNRTTIPLCACRLLQRDWWSERVGSTDLPSNLILRAARFVWAGEASRGVPGANTTARACVEQPVALPNCPLSF